jgi:[acyl-carrier-protein] S-malonyltransferase
MGLSSYKETHMKKIAFIFPGQGAQTVGMGKDFAEKYAAAKETFEEADDTLKRGVSSIVWNGPMDLLTETKNSQTGIYVTSIALLRVLNNLFPNVSPYCCGGLSLGEYSALTASGRLSFQEGLPLVEKRGQYMNDACLSTKGSMAVVMGLEANQVEDLVKEADLPHDLWVANLNCPGQVVISGTLKGIELGSERAKARGAKRVLPLQVFGAFHSGLMEPAKERLKPEILATRFNDSSVRIAMNTTGGFVDDAASIQKSLIEQVVSPVRWEQDIRTMDKEGVSLYIEIGCGKTLSGMNKRIGVQGETLSLEKIEDLETIAKVLS